MKVLHLLDVSRPTKNGYSSRSDAIIRNLRALDVETCQLTSQKYDLFSELEEDIDGVKYYRTTKAKGLFVKLPILSYIDHVRHMTNRALDVIEREKPDVIHAHSPMLNGLVALRLRKITGIPVMYEVRAFWEDAAVDTGKITENGLQYRLIRGIEQYVFNRVDKVSCICEGLKKEIEGRNVTAKRLIVAQNSVDLNKFSLIKEKNKDLEKELGLENKKVIAFLGSFFKYEGLEFLIKSIKQIVKKIPNVHVLLVGGGNESDNLVKLANDLDVSQYITFTGRIDYNEITKYYSLVDLLVFPRENIRLTQLVTPLKPLEAMAQGIPVIASDIGGHREMIKHGETGLLFTPEDPNELAQTVVKLLSDDQLKEKLVANGLAYVTHTRNWKNTASAYLPAYEQLIAKK